MARLRQSQLRQQLKAASVQSGPNAVSVLRVMTGAATVLLGMIAVIAALVAAVIGIVGQHRTVAQTVTVDQPQIVAVTAIVDQRRIAAVTEIVDRPRTGVVTDTNAIAPPPATEAVTEIADRLRIVDRTATGIVDRPQIAAVTVATTVTVDRPRPATGIVDQLLTGAVIGTGIVVATATEGQIVEAIAAPLTVDVTVATASLNS